jgi:hypothetical protein
LLRGEPFLDRASNKRTRKRIKRDRQANEIYARGGKTMSRMNEKAQEVFNLVDDALQIADGIDGVKGKQYINLMHIIANEVLHKARYVSMNMEVKENETN